MEFITTNLTGMVRNDTMEGRKYLVVPMIMMVEGVLNGSNGPLYYPASELAKVPQVWNHKPVVVYHPTMNGKALSACDPDIISTQKIGVIMNTTFDGHRLRAEAWLEEDRIVAVDNRVLDAVLNNMMMEVSTGLFTENEDVAGEFNGKPYVAIARNYRPDHLAILPDQIGACSIADGAGLLRVNAAHLHLDVEKALQYLGVAQNEMSHGEINHMLRMALDPNMDKSIWVEDVFDDWFVYEKEGKFYKQEYVVEKEEDVRLVGVPVEVEKKIVYQDLSGNVITNVREENLMDKDKFVGELIKNSAWTEEDRKFLLGLNEDQLQKMAPTENEDDEGGEKGLEVAPKAVEPAKAEVAPATNTAPVTNTAMTPEQFLASAPMDIREVLNDAMATHAIKKGQLIEKITANVKNVFTKDQLANMSVNELVAIAALAETEPEKTGPAANYFGMAPIGNVGGKVQEPLLAPTMNFAEKA
jgi:hypothetical protein